MPAACGPLRQALAERRARRGRRPRRAEHDRRPVAALSGELELLVQGRVVYAEQHEVDRLRTGPRASGRQGRPATSAYRGFTRYTFGCAGAAQDLGDEPLAEAARPGLAPTTATDRGAEHRPHRVRVRSPTSRPSEPLTDCSV